MSRLASSAVALTAVLLTACAGAPAGGRDWCAEAFVHSDGLLRAGLDEYVEKMKRFTLARDPQVSTAGAEARVHDRAVAWSAAHEGPAVEECRGWSEERLVCVLEAKHASELAPCGLESLVQSFTDEVVAEYAARPFDEGSGG